MAEFDSYDPEETYKRIHRRFEAMEVPPCGWCVSQDTASVQVGLIGLTIRLAATCRKFKLIANGPKEGEWFCRACGRFFDVPENEPGEDTPDDSRPSVDAHTAIQPPRDGQCGEGLQEPHEGTATDPSTVGSSHPPHGLPKKQPPVRPRPQVDRQTLISDAEEAVQGAAKYRARSVRNRSKKHSYVAALFHDRAAQAYERAGLGLLARSQWRQAAAAYAIAGWRQCAIQCDSRADSIDPIWEDE